MSKITLMNDALCTALPAVIYTYGYARLYARTCRSLSVIRCRVPA